MYKRQDLPICADAKLTLEALIDEIKGRNIKAKPAKLEIPQIRAELERKTDYENIPIKPQRVFKEINEFFDEETVFVTCIGLNQIWSGQLQKISKPRHYPDCGGAGPLGWDLPAAIGAKVARPEKQIVQVVGDYGFQFCMEELPVAVMYNIPFVCIILNNGYLGLIRQAEKYNFEMDYEVQIWYDSLKASESAQIPRAAAAGKGVGGGVTDSGRARLQPENEGRGFDFVKFADACGTIGERVTDPKDLKDAFQRGIDSGVPYIIDVIMERDTDCSMGLSIDAIKEFE